jgi:hypothetical protein
MYLTFLLLPFQVCSFNWKVTPGFGPFVRGVHAFIPRVRRTSKGAILRNIVISIKAKYISDRNYAVLLIKDYERCP